MAVDTTRGFITLMEEFDTDHIGCAGNAVRWVTVLDNSGTFAVSDSPELQAASVTGSCNDNYNSIGHRLTWSAQAGMMSMEARVDLERITTVGMWVGLTSNMTEATQPVTLSGTTFTSTATTAIGFVYCTDATNDNWHAFMVDDCNDTSVPIATLNTGVAPVADTPQTLKVVVYDQQCGNQTRAEFYIDGNLEVTMDSAVDRDVLLGPLIGHTVRDGCPATANVHYIETIKTRP